jgi:hypothetical protein
MGVKIFQIDQATACKIQQEDPMQGRGSQNNFQKKQRIKTHSYPGMLDSAFQFQPGKKCLLCYFPDSTGGQVAQFHLLNAGADQPHATVTDSSHHFPYLPEFPFGDRDLQPGTFHISRDRSW